MEICLFDLDETLVRTDDLEAIRLAGKHNDNLSYIRDLRRMLDTRRDRHIYTKNLLSSIRSQLPNTKFGIFTRSPSSYAHTVLNWAYPNFEWDIVIAYEDVRRTKPHGEGIRTAIAKLDGVDLDRIVLVGDSVCDVKAAYNAGCYIILDKSNWPKRFETEHWWALERVPDAIIDRPEDLIFALKDIEAHLPELERLMTGRPRHKPYPRFDRIGHFIPGEQQTYQIFCSGRSFANYEFISARQNWHDLTESIQEQKRADKFPPHWITTLKNFIATSIREFQNTYVCVIPHRPGRKPRLEFLLMQLQVSYGSDVALRQRGLTMIPDLLAYREGVRSNSNDHLNKADRFTNVRQHLYVNRLDVIDPDSLYIVIDDVATSGSTLCYAQKYLQAKGAKHVRLFSVAKNISGMEQ